jgi:hypothetical protein
MFQSPGDFGNSKQGRLMRLRIPREPDVAVEDFAEDIPEGFAQTSDA